MVQLTLAALLLAASSLATPLTSRQDAQCQTTWNGTSLTGSPSGAGCRYAIRYGNAARWEDPTPAQNQDGVDAGGHPAICPQYGNNTSITGEPLPQAEDCLFAVAYTPGNVTAESKLPVFVWVHGGSFTSGSASDIGLDGTSLATTGNLIVVNVQYRLGVLGFLPPDAAPSAGDPSLGVKDVILVLKQIAANIGAMGGDPSQVTIGGQSAGASLVRALWGAPAAKGLYRSMIMQSDPMNYGTQSNANADGLQTAVFGNATLGNCTDWACFQKLQLSDIIAVQSYVEGTAPSTIEGVPTGEVYRPQFNTATIPEDPFDSLFNNVSDLSVVPHDTPIMLTSTRNEAGWLLQKVLPTASVASPFLYNSFIQRLVGKDRLKIISASGLYNLSSAEDGLRISLDKLITDGAWRCIARSAAQRYAAAGGSVYVGEWTRGVTSPSNSVAGDFCNATGRVCHADDIFPTFHSAPNADQDLTSFEDGISAHWISFIKTGNPGTSDAWKAYSANSTAADVKVLGPGEVDECPADFWGSKVRWDWQIYGEAEANVSVTDSAPAANSSSPTGSGGDKGSGGGRAGVSVAAGVFGVLALAVLF